MKFAYADPPYPGLAKRYDDQPICAEVNFRLLIAHLCEFDGWALSVHSPALRDILPLCPPSCRVAAWVKPFCSFKMNVDPAYAWEPVIFQIGRKRTREELTVRDWVSVNCTLRRGFVGAKPDGFCCWLFELLGASPDDEFCDLFPGSGAVSRAWENWRLWQGSAPVQLELVA